MRYLLMTALMLFSFSACSKEEAKSVEAKKVEIKTDKVSKTTEAVVPAPCDSKEDILKKLEEKKKAEAESGKGFSLQGGNTGCSVK
ncbi:MAG: hypothetical protein PHY93_14670 [Bacteriovorax sp.]|nr:hypothetical protein [Bacteriovorax sp.]